MKKIQGAKNLENYHPGVKPINVPRRDPDIYYIMKRYWDDSLKAPVTQEYVDKNRGRLIQDKKDTRDGLILERKGKYWEGEGIDDLNNMLTWLHFSEQIIHPDKYKLPCCFVKKRKKLKKIRQHKRKRKKNKKQKLRK